MQSPYFDMFNYYAERMVEHGLASTMLYQNPNDISCSTTEHETFRPFGYQEVWTVFAASGVIFFLAIAYCIAECIVYHFRHGGRNEIRLNIEMENVKGNLDACSCQF